MINAVAAVACYSRSIMARRRLENRLIRKLTKTSGGRSYAVILPIEFVRELAWRERQKLTVRKVGSRLIVEDWKR